MGDRETRIRDRGDRDYRSREGDLREDRNRGRSREQTNHSKKKQKTKWQPPSDIMPNSGLNAIPHIIPAGLTIEQQETLLMRVRMEEIARKINFSDLNINYGPDRSPSPEPIYDKDGKRVNTREQRAKDKLNNERTELVEIAMAMYPNFRPPADYEPGSQKKTRKIFIPIEKHPEYNFIGLIIGPRGNTQKRMERETGAKISIRGKGSVKEGKVGQQPYDNEPLHVLVSADTTIQLEKACKMVAELLVPIDEKQNIHKQQQLKELAEINGTLRDRSWMQPMERSFEMSNVKCSICGEKSHPTTDCPLKGKAGVKPILPEDTETLDEEYSKFLSEIGEDAPQPEKKQEDAYDEFLKNLKEENQKPSTLPPWMQQTTPWAAPSTAPVPPPWAAPYPMPGVPPVMPGVPSVMPGVPPVMPVAYPPYPGMPPVPQQASYDTTQQTQQ